MTLGVASSGHNIGTLHRCEVDVNNPNWYGVCGAIPFVAGHVTGAHCTRFLNGTTHLVSTFGGMKVVPFVQVTHASCTEQPYCSMTG